MASSLWELVRGSIILLSFIFGVGWGIFWILTPLLGDLTPFDGLKWTGIGILWILSTFWEFSHVDL